MSRGLTIEGLSFSYAKDGPSTVADVDLIADEEEVLAVVGPSGSGKTTLVRLIGGLLSPSAGRISIGGNDMAEVPPERRPIAMVFQGLALYPHMDVASNMAFGLAIRKVPKRDREAPVREIAERLGIAHILTRRPGEISGGERQRVALGRALLRNPSVFLLDEPLSNLDPMLRASARRDLGIILRQDRRCAVYVTHDQIEAMTLGDRVAVMRDGQIEQVGPARELYEHPATSFVASFIGTPPMSLVPVGTAGLRGPHGAVMLGVRAEHVDLIPGEEAFVRRVDDLGHDLIAELDIEGVALLARLGHSHDIRRGMRTGFSVSERHVHGFDAKGRAIR